MATSFDFPTQRELIFPERCTCCGKPKEAETSLIVSRNVAKGQKQVQHSATVQVPLCARCNRIDQGILLVSLIAFGLGLIVVGIACFALLFVGDQKTGLSNALGLENVRGAWCGIVLPVAFLVGVLGGFVVEAIAKFLFIPLFGRALYHAPFLALQLIGDVSYTAGLQASLSKDGQALRLKFFNDDIAAEFQRLNS